MLTMGTMISSNKVMATIGARNLKSAIARLEKMKADHPDLAVAAVIQGKIGQKEEQQDMFSNPQRAKELAFGKVIVVLDQLEERLNEGDFLCGPHFTLADALFTCLLVSFIDSSCLISAQVGDDQVAGGGVEEQEEVGRVVVKDGCQAVL